MAWEACEANFRYDLLALDRKCYALVCPTKYAMVEPVAGDSREDIDELAASDWEERRRQVYGLFPHWRGSLRPHFGTRHSGFESHDLKTRARAWIALWELMETWTNGRVAAETRTLDAVGMLKKEIQESGSHKLYPPLLRAVLGAGVCISFEFGRNFVEAFRRPPVVPHFLE